MKKYTAKIALITLIAAGLAAPMFLHAQDASTNAPDATTSAPKPKHAHHGLPFHGTVDGVDTNAMTLTVGSRTFQITSKTKISNNGQPAILADGVVGEKVSGAYRTNTDGTLTASSVYFGTHPKKKKNNSDSENTSTNSVSGN